MRAQINSLRVQMAIISFIFVLFPWKTARSLSFGLKALFVGAINKIILVRVQ